MVPKQSSLIAPMTLNRHKVRPILRKTTVQCNWILGTSGAITSLTAPTTSSQGVAFGNTFGVALNILPALELTGLQALYTHYKLKKVRYTFTINAEGFTGIVANAQTILRMYMRYFYDADIASTPVNSQMVFEQMQNVKLFQFGGEGNQATYTWYPRILETVSTGGLLTSSNAAAKPKWFDMEYPNIPHIGIAWLVPFFPAGATLTLDQELTYVLKDQR